ncbi:MAG: glutamine synthetase [Firmicutes bacterium]|nr:glutamine synthetase [Bacillota bacterium]
MASTLSRMLFCITPDKHEEAALQQCLSEHPEIKFVSLVGLDVFGHDTDEKVPVREIFKDYKGFLKNGVQTDGSSVLLPGIADITNARVDIVPDADANWYVDHNFDNIDEETGLPVGTLRIPAVLMHNSGTPVGSRAILRDAVAEFKRGLVQALRDNPYVFEFLPIDSADEIEEVQLTAATELEFYVKTPHEVADKEKLHTSQEMKEQYWKRTIGPVRTALEKTLEVLDYYGFEVEMGHKEVGGVKADITTDGYDHIMEQLEIDWRYSDPMGTADKDNLARYVIKDVFRSRGLDVTFMAKPVEGVAGSGKHTHFGAAVKLKDGRKVNLFSALDPEKDYLSPVGFGALMGLLKHYEIINPLASATTDSLNRLKPGYEAPICIVTSLGRDVKTPSRNRTVLAGLIRDAANPLATRFELRSPNPKSNCYLVLAGGFLAMLDGIEKCLAAKKSPADLAASISKKYGDEDFYLEKDRVYRAENNIFTDYTAEEREKYFGRSPATVYENIMAFDEYPEKAAVLFKGDAMTPKDLASYKQAVLELWATELHDRIIPQMAAEGSPASGITALSEALEAGDYAAASEKLKELRAL